MYVRSRTVQHLIYLLMAKKNRKWFIHFSFKKRLPICQYLILLNQQPQDPISHL